MEFGVIDENLLFCKQIKNELNNNHLSHAYLIETNNNSIDVVKNYILFFVKKIYEDCCKNNNVTISKEKIFNLVDKNLYPDYTLVFPSGSQIKKEQMLEIRDKYKSKSLYGTKQIYVVFDADKMNLSCSNTILKFLEEPSDGVIGIFVVNNRYNVLDTILSRCQVLSLEKIDGGMVDLTEDELVFVDNIKNRKEKDLLLNFDFYLNSLFKDKEISINTIKKLNLYYTDILNNFDGLYYSIDELIYIISILEESLNKLKYNVNIKLWLDYLLISLMEV